MPWARAWDAAGLTDLCARTQGASSVTIGIIDGPTALEHPHFQGTQMDPIGPGPSGCQVPDSYECGHGTFVAGVLAAQRGPEHAGIAPGCRVLLRPIFHETRPGVDTPAVQTLDLVRALSELLDQGAHVVNMSLGLADTRLGEQPELTAVFDRAQSQGTLLVAAAGNHGNVGQIPLFSHPWVIPVVGTDASGGLLAQGNLGASLGRYGLSAPGQSVVSTAPGGGVAAMTGTSAAAPFVSGAAALLLSLFPTASPVDVQRALRQPGARRTSVVPPALNADASLRWLQSRQEPIA